MKIEEVKTGLKVRMTKEWKKKICRSNGLSDCDVAYNRYTIQNYGNCIGTIREYDGKSIMIDVRWGEGMTYSMRIHYAEELEIVSEC